MVNILVAGFLAAHGLVHALYLAPRPPAREGAPAWPFDLAHSWLVSRAGQDVRVVALVGTALAIATVAGFGLSALATAGWIVPVALWPMLVLLSAATSALLLAIFFHRYLLVGFLIDAVLVWAVLVMSWNPT
jgi:hypothetical protein